MLDSRRKIHEIQAKDPLKGQDYPLAGCQDQEVFGHLANKTGSLFPCNRMRKECQYPVVSHRIANSQ